VSPQDKAEIARLIAQAVQPLQDQIDAQKAVDRRHSGQHRNLATDIRASRSDVTTRVDDTVQALAHRDQQLITALNEVRASVSRLESQSIPPVAEASHGAKKAAVNAELAANMVRVDVDQAKQATTKQLKWVAAIPSVIYTVVEFLKLLHQAGLL
jgi:hypothetical protein